MTARRKLKKKKIGIWKKNHGAEETDFETSCDDGNVWGDIFICAGVLFPWFKTIAHYQIDVVFILTVWFNQSLSLRLIIDSVYGCMSQWP